MYWTLWFFFCISTMNEKKLRENTCTQKKAYKLSQLQLCHMMTYCWVLYFFILNPFDYPAIEMFVTWKKNETFYELYAIEQQTNYIPYTRFWMVLFTSKCEKSYWCHFTVQFISHESNTVQFTWRKKQHPMTYGQWMFFFWSQRLRDSFKIKINHLNTHKVP